MRFIEVEEDSEGQRIDNFLVKSLKGVPKSKIYRCVRKGEVRVNGGRVKASTKLKLGDRIRIPPIRTAKAPEDAVSGQLIDILYNSIIYEDNRMLIVNKPPGMAVHGGSGINAGVIEALRRLRPEEKSLELVHRLDRDTSGCLMVAKKRSHLKRLQQFLNDKTALSKQYLAVVHGRWPKRKHQVNLPLQKNTLRSGERISRVSAGGKPSLTEFEVVKQSDQFSLLAIKLVTGRTHQIRVHCQHTGFPVVGDRKYGNEDLDRGLLPKRLMLHAERLVIPGVEQDQASIIVETEPDEAFIRMINSVK